MTRYYQAALCALICVGLTAPANADICFDFTGGENSAHFMELDNQNNATTMAMGFAATFTALSTSGTPELNFHSADGLGVNIDGDGGDESNKLDAGVGIESIEMVVSAGIELDSILIDGMGWDSDTDYEYADLLVNNVYFATLLDTDANAATQALHTNAIVGAASDTFTGLGILLNAGDSVTITYGEAGSNNGFRIEKIALVPEPSAFLLMSLVGGASLFVRRRS